MSKKRSKKSAYLLLIPAVILAALMICELYVNYVSLKSKQSNYYEVDMTYYSFEHSIGDVELFHESFSLYSPRQIIEISRFKSDIKETEISDTYSLIKKFNHSYVILGPDTMLRSIEAEPYSCHLKSHIIGRVVFAQEGNDLIQAVNVCGNRCASGCFHGVMMGFFEAKKGVTLREGADESDIFEDKGFIDELVDAALFACDSVNNQTDFFTEGICFHTIGHAIMFLSQSNITIATSFCDKLENRDTEKNVLLCYSGAYMERALLHGMDDLAVSPVYPCDEEMKYPQTCYAYKMRYLPFQDVPYLANICLNQTGLQRKGCFFGLGEAYRKSDSSDLINAMDDICSYGTDNDKENCIKGIYWRTVRLKGIDTFRKNCEKFPDQNLRDYCIRISKNTAVLVMK